MYVSAFDKQFGSNSKIRSIMNVSLNEDLLSAKSIVIYGAGIEGIRTLIDLRENNLSPLFIIDNDAGLTGSNVCGIEIHSKKQLDKLDRNTAIIITPSKYALTITDELENLGFNNLFYRSFSPRKWDIHNSKLEGKEELLKQNKNKIDFVRSNLFDRKSVKVFDAAILARKDSNSTGLEKYIDPNKYYPNDITEFNLKKNEVYADVGAYDGGGVLNFISMAGGQYKHIYAFEPDPINYALTKATVKHYNLKKVDVLQLGLSDCAKDSMLSSSLLGSKISDSGDVKVHLDTLDNVFSKAKHRPTFISMNIEGAEPEALIGARKIIEKDRPKLAISIYHYPINQLWDIPYYMMKAHPKYRYYIRQYHCYTSTILYAL